ncbi:hypothetical protein [uncultured Planktomarina sp.]|uniref:hypothetical protein n=1 Tax=uncultured Planktomarina sp. TaxID=1538529 RepID=UPI00288D91E4|nr:hypothetical protein [Planktomarina sp.]
MQRDHVKFRTPMRQMRLNWRCYCYGCRDGQIIGDDALRPPSDTSIKSKTA